MNNLVEVKNLEKKYGSKEAVKGISFNIKQNEILGLLGPNGCGKTTTIGMMLGLLKPTDGEILIDGKKIKFILNGGTSKVGLESTIVSLIKKPQILRLGGIETSKINKVLRARLKYNKKKI